MNEERLRDCNHGRENTSSAIRNKRSRYRIFRRYLDRSARNFDTRLPQKPYPYLNRLRDSDPIVWSPKGKQWLILGYDDAFSILRDNRFGKRLDKWRHPRLLPRMAVKFFRRRGVNSMLLLAPPDHTRIRSLVNSAFTPPVVHALSTRIESITASLLDEMEEDIRADGKTDLINRFAFPLPVIVIAELLGIPPEDRAQFKSWSGNITLALEATANVYKIGNSLLAMRNLRAYLKKVIRDKKANPGNDVISMLIRAQSAEDGTLSEEELLANTILILIAGHETTVNLISNAVKTLLTHRDQLELLLNDNSLIPNAVEETLRYDPPVHIVRRLANEDVEVSGRLIRANEALTVLIGGCNRDPNLVSKPDTFDITRKGIKHITFGAGIHFCLGAELARTEARIALNRLFERFPDLELAESAESYKGPFALRGLTRLVLKPKDQ